MNREEDLQKILNLKVGGTAYVNWFEEGGGEVLKCDNYYILYDIPQYGGEGWRYGDFPLGEEEAVLDVAYSWN